MEAGLGCDWLVDYVLTPKCKRLWWMVRQSLLFCLVARGPYQNQLQFVSFIIVCYNSCERGRAVVDSIPNTSCMIPKAVAVLHACAMTTGDASLGCSMSA